MSRRSKRARLGNVKRNINIVLATIYLLLSGFLLFLIFKHNILAFRYLNILTAVLIFISAVIAILLIVYKKAEKFTVFFLTLAIVVSSVPSMLCNSLSVLPIISMRPQTTQSIR